MLHGFSATVDHQVTHPSRIPGEIQPDLHVWIEFLVIDYALSSPSSGSDCPSEGLFPPFQLSSQPGYWEDKAHMGAL